jgi:hypothetical protein
MKASRAWVVGVLAAALLAASPGRAHAGPGMPPVDSVGRYTGIIGMTMMGFELVFDVELAVGLRHPAILSISGIVGAAGAGIGGYFTEKALMKGRAAGTGPGPVAVVFLCVGMAGVVPTVIAWKNTNFAKSSKEPKAESPSADTAVPGATPMPAPEPGPAPAVPGAPAPGTGGLVSVTPAGVFIGPPAVLTAPSMTALEAEALGPGAASLAARADETRFTVLRLDF